jgi:hypothetical protein
MAGTAAAAPVLLVLVAFGSLQVTADQVMRLPRFWTACLVVGAFALAGVAYGALFQRAANDRRAGWLLGMSYGFVLWIAAPVVALPLAGDRVMASGPPATGFFVSFLLWGLVVGAVFPLAHRPLYAKLGDDLKGSARRLGPDVVTLKERILRRPG